MAVNSAGKGSPRQGEDGEEAEDAGKEELALEGSPFDSSEIPAGAAAKLLLSKTTEPHMCHTSLCVRVCVQYFKPYFNERLT